MAAALNILIGASLATAQISAAAAAAAPSLTWTEWESQPGVFAPDSAVDIVHWVDDQGTPQASDDIPYVFMTGYQTTANGATVFATYKYEARFNPNGQFAGSAFFPPLSQNPTGINKAIAMTVDPQTGDVYVTGESFDALAGTGLDYVTIRYNSNLGIPVGWTSASIYDGPASGDDVPADITYLPGSDPGAGVVVVTGRSAGVGTGDDIATILYDVTTGTPSGLWEALDTAQPAGIRRYNGSASKDDRAVGVTATGFVVNDSLAGVWAWVGGTARVSRGPGIDDDDIVMLAYADNPNPNFETGWLVVERLFNRVSGGDDIATAMTSIKDGQGVSINWAGSFVTIAGYSPGTTAGDTDYAVLNYQLYAPATPAWLANAWSGSAPVRFFDGLAQPQFSDDQPLAIDVESEAVGALDYRTWITGRVREADGTGYDNATIVYDASIFNAPLERSWIWDVRRTDDRATAIDVHGDSAYIAGWSSRGSIVRHTTFKFSLANSFGADWTKVYTAVVGPDAGEAIVAEFDSLVTPATFPVFVTGSSTLDASGKDQFTLRYDQP